MNLTPALAAVALVVALAAPAAADFEPIPTPPGPKCGQANVLRTVHSDHVTWSGKRWPVEASNGAYTAAMYIDVRTGVGAPFKRVYWTVTSVTVMEGCTIASVKARTPWHGENRAVVKDYATSGKWGGTSIYRHLRAKCVDCD